MSPAWPTKWDAIVFAFATALFGHLVAVAHYESVGTKSSTCFPNYTCRAALVCQRADGIPEPGLCVARP